MEGIKNVYPVNLEKGKNVTETKDVYLVNGGKGKNVAEIKNVYLVNQIKEEIQSLEM